MIIDDLPERWTIRTLGEVASLVAGAGFPLTHQNQSHNELPFFKVGNLGEVGPGESLNQSNHTISASSAKELGAKIIPAGATVFAKIGMAIQLNRRRQLAQRSCIDNNMMAAIPDDNVVDARYLLRFLETVDLMQLAHATTVPAVRKSDLEQIPIPIPALAEQRLIVAVVDVALAKRSIGADHIRAARRAMEKFRQAVLAAACSGRLTTDWRDAHPDACGVEQALTELPGKKSGRHSDDDLGDLPLPDLPDRYVVSTVGRASLVLQYGTSKRSDSDSTGVPVLRMGNIQDSELELDDLKYTPMDREIERLILEDGDVLFNRTNSPELVGKSAVFHEHTPMTFASYLIRVRFASDVADPDFVNYWINSAWGKAWARQVKTDGVSQSNINGTKLGAMPLPLPPINEQREIVRRASQMLEVADGLLARIRMASRRVDRSSQAVLAKAFRGELPLGHEHATAVSNHLS